MEVLLEDMARTLKAPVTLPIHPGTIPSISHPTSTPPRGTSRPTSMPTSAYSQPDTPPPSPPLATSPTPQLLREMSSLSLGDDEGPEEARSPDMEVRKHVAAEYRPLKRLERFEMDRVVTGPSVNAGELKRRSGGIQAGG